MAMIFVTCSQCRSRFQADEKHAGKTVPCPKCKNPLRIPTPEDDVVIHGGELFESGPKDTQGRVVLRPVERTQTHWSWKIAIPVFVGIAIFLTATWFLRDVFASTPSLSYIGVLLISVPYVLGAYHIFRDDDLEPYRGRELWIRVLIVSAVYVLLWPLLDYVLKLFGGPIEIYWWFLIAPPILFVGAIASEQSLEISFSDGLLHYTGFLLIGGLWRWFAGIQNLWNGGLFLTFGS